MRRVSAWTVTASVVLLTMLLLPVIAIMWSTPPGRLVDALGHPLVAPALQLSLWTSLTSLGVIVALGTPLAWALARREGRAVRGLQTLLELPIVLPPAVIGVGLLLAFGRQGLLGGVLAEAGVGVAFTSAAVVLAQTVVAAPFYVQSATAAFRSVDDELIVVARTLGASPQRTFWRVAVPLALPGLINGAAMAWARALGEFGATLLFAGSMRGITQTLPLAIYAALETDVVAAQAISVLLVVVAFALLVVLRGPVAARIVNAGTDSPRRGG